jgi:hypothetical protein
VWIEEDGRDKISFFCKILQRPVLWARSIRPEQCSTILYRFENLFTPSRDVYNIIHSGNKLTHQLHALKVSVSTALYCLYHNPVTTRTTVHSITELLNYWTSKRSISSLLPLLIFPFAIISKQAPYWLAASSHISRWVCLSWTATHRGGTWSTWAVWVKP